MPAALPPIFDPRDLSHQWTAPDISDAPDTPDTPDENTIDVSSYSDSNEYTVRIDNGIDEGSRQVYTIASDNYLESIDGNYHYPDELVDQLADKIIEKLDLEKVAKDYKKEIKQKIIPIKPMTFDHLEVDDNKSE